MPAINKQTFIQSINAIKFVEQFQKGVLGVIDTLNNDPTLLAHYCDLGAMIYPDCSGALLEVLEEIMKDTSGVIAYFCYELNFGEGWYPGCFVDSNRVAINLSTTDDLWNYLTEDDV